MRVSKTSLAVLQIGLLWLAFSIALIVNRGPIFFPDTTAYVRIADAAAISVGAHRSEWSDRLPDLRMAKVGGEQAAKPTMPTNAPTALAGRSIYYGAGLLALGPMLAALAQALTGALAVYLLARRFDAGMSIGILPAVIAMSSAPIFAALLMPDFFAALAILATAMLLPGWAGMPRPQRVFWLVLLIVGIVSHSATLLIVMAMLLCGWAFLRRRAKVWPVAAAIAIGIVAEATFAFGVTQAIGTPPLRPPFLSARLIADGPGRAFLDRECVRPRFVVCRFYREFPANSDVILWRDGGKGFVSMPPAVQRAWSAQDMPLTLAIFASAPVDASAAWARAVVKQASHYTLNDVTAPLELLDRLPSGQRARYGATLVARNAFPASLWNATSAAMLALAIVALIAFRRRLRVEHGLVMLGLVLDVVICGALSTPHDRYLMRVAWLLPVIAVTIVPWRRGAGPRGLIEDQPPPQPA